jgi:heme o synthase
MAGLSTPALDIGSRQGAPSLASLRAAAIPDFLALTKPEVNFLIVIATFTGFYLGYAGDLHNFPVERMFNALCGTLLVASGTGTLNQYLEHRFDARMRRTSRRPIAAGRLRPRAAAWFGISLSIVGSVYLLATVNALSSALAVFTAATYLLIYTPLKRRTPLCTLVGAVPGAMPPLIGWAAASGSVASAKAWMLYAILFLWQFPHFMAIAWMYREDYARAGYLVLPPGEQSGRFMSWQALLAALALIPASLIPTVVGHTGIVYSVLAAILSSLFFYYGAGLAFQRSAFAARRLLLASIVYLPLAFCLLMLEK